MDRMNAEISESPAVPSNDTSTGSDEPFPALDPSHEAFMIPWNTSASVRYPRA